MTNRNPLLETGEHVRHRQRIFSAARETAVRATLPGMNTLRAELENLRRQNREDSPAKHMASEGMTEATRLLGEVKDRMALAGPRFDRMCDLLEKMIERTA